MSNSKIKENLAYAYQILSHLRLDDHTYTHLSARTQEKNSFFIYPFGMRFEEVTPDTLMKVSSNGKVLEGEEYQYNETGYTIHGAVYEDRPDVGAVFHLHTPAIVAVSACVQGLMPLSQWALHFYNRVSYHDYDSLELNKTQRSKLQTSLGRNYVMIMRNHGALVCGRTLHEAAFYAYHLHQACLVQCLASSMNQPLIVPDQNVCEKSVQDLLGFEKDLGLRDWQAWVRLIDKKNSRDKK
ncbi:MAG: class II aldolase/adducin family protein [Janthinobacterium lividum]